MNTQGIMRRIGVVVALIVSLPIQVIAETGPLGFGQPEFGQEMETDRPDFTEGTQTVAAGHLQVELGYLFTSEDEDSVETTSHEIPQTLVRVGLADEFELRLAWDGYIDIEEELDSGETTDMRGGGDMSVGFKHFMLSQDDFVPNLSAILELGLPVGDSDLTSDEVVPAFKLLWAYDLDEWFSLAGNVNFESPVEDNERFFETSASLALGAGITDTIGSYVEYYGFYPDGGAPDSTSRHFLNGGFTFGITENLQFDALVGFGLNSEADDFFTGGGISFRI